MYRVCVAHLRVIAPRQHSSIGRYAAAVASRWEHCVRFNGPRLKPGISRFRDERVTAQPTGENLKERVPLQKFQ